MYVRKGVLLTAANARAYDEQHDNGAKWLTPEERLEERRARAAANFENNKQIAELIESMEILGVDEGKSPTTCAYCRDQIGHRIPFKECTVEMLPPFACCTSPEGCRCWASAVFLDPDSIGRLDL